MKSAPNWTVSRSICPSQNAIWNEDTATTIWNTVRQHQQETILQTIECWSKFSYKIVRYSVFVFGFKHHLDTVRLPLGLQSERRKKKWLLPYFYADTSVRFYLTECCVFTILAFSQNRFEVKPNKITEHKHIFAQTSPCVLHNASQSGICSIRMEWFSNAVDAV